jgi:hypothetical protein
MSGVVSVPDSETALIDTRWLYYDPEPEVGWIGLRLGPPGYCFCTFVFGSWQVRLGRYSLRWDSYAYQEAAGVTELGSRLTFGRLGKTYWGIL